MISQLNSNIEQSVDTYLVNVMGICIDFLSIDPGNGFFLRQSERLMAKYK